MSGDESEDSQPRYSSVVSGTKRKKGAAAKPPASGRHTINAMMALDAEESDRSESASDAEDGGIGSREGSDDDGSDRGRHRPHAHKGAPTPKPTVQVPPEEEGVREALSIRGRKSIASTIVVAMNTALYVVKEPSKRIALKL